MNNNDLTTATIYGRFAQQVSRRPDAIAISTDAQSVTFAELDHLVNRIMTKIERGNHSRVGIVMSHGIRQVAAMLAVLKSGAAYIPAETTLPKKRIDYMMETADVSLIIDDKFCTHLPEGHNYPDKSKSEGLAYILYTSGTTGKPKGVMVENSSVVNYVDAFAAEMRIGPGDAMLQYSICSFDIFVEEVYATLLNGAMLVIPSATVHDGPLPILLNFCRRHNVSIIDGFPYLIADINKQADLLPRSVRLIVSGGDVVRASYITNLRGRGIEIYNTYGPSETTVCSNYYRIDNATPLADGTFPIGKAIKGVEVKIMDKNGVEVPEGRIGEICILGKGVSRGYLGNPPEQANFVTMADGTRMYRSGDIGYMMEDGNVAFMHRCDNQVMILGRRVEPDEVENVLNEFPGVEHGIVRAFPDESGLHYLVAYIQPSSVFALNDLKAWMKSRLADFMMPEFFITMPRIPLTDRGKVDISALPIILKEPTYAA